MPEQSVSSSHGKVRLPGLDPEVTPMIGLGLSVTGILLGLRPRLAPWSLALTALTALLYRDPERTTPEAAGAFFAPTDGVVTGVGETYEHRFLHTDAVQLSIESSPLDVPVQRSPVAGTVAYLERVAGAYRPLWELHGAPPEQRECQYIGILAECGPVLLAVSVGPLARRIACRVSVGDQVGAGARLTTVRFGARVELLVPRDVIEWLPAPGDRLRAGVSTVGRMAPL
ncbi:MAG TPA: phosphatidylserine decarboxylase [Roseiflexaceae bacterium]|nr:phosphatidylserine decarboxylase [Roseiflexaceae bacterium]